MEIQDYILVHGKIINIKNNANVSKVLCYRPKDVIVEHEKGE